VLKDDDEPVVRTTGELDRVYVDAPPRLVLHEPHRNLEIVTTGFPDVVVWNPGAEKAAAMRDMEPGGAEHMLCVEAAAVQRRVALDVGRHWQGSQTLVALSRD
jgi:glucose-6-phosphate 1-epimerase